MENCNRLLLGTLAFMSVPTAIVSGPIFGQSNRYALVIGNGTYTEGIRPLSNPVSDATDIAAAAAYLTKPYPARSLHLSDYNRNLEGL